MSSSRDFMQNQLKKWKNAATQLIANDNEGETPDETSLVELEPEYAEKCRQLAAARNTTVSAVVHYMLKQQLALNGQTRLLKANAEQLESNPLLALDALTGRRSSTWEAEDADDAYA